MDSDEVNSISDTIESAQVAEIVRETYDDLVSTLTIPEREALIHLEALSDVTRPNFLRIPDNLKNIVWLRYAGAVVDYLTPEQFIDYVIKNPGDATVSDPITDVEYTVANDKNPIFYTCFDDTYLVFSSFNQDVESTLQESNSLAYGSISTSFLLEDDFICDLDENLFPLLLAEAKNACFTNLKQVSNANEERRARRQLVRVQNEFSKTKTDPKSRLPNYGRIAP